MYRKTIMLDFYFALYIQNPDVEIHKNSKKNTSKSVYAYKIFEYKLQI